MVTAQELLDGMEIDGPPNHQNASDLSTIYATLTDAAEALLEAEPATTTTTTMVPAPTPESHCHSS